MTWNNPNPLANPLNSRQYQSHCSFDRNNLHVPVSRPFDPFSIPQDNGLHTPNQLPLGSGGGYLSMMNSKRFVTLPDGSVMDVVSKKMVRNNSHPIGNSWGSRTIDPFGRKESEWNDRDIYSSPFSSGNGEGLSMEDAKYQNMCKIQDDKLRKNMSPLQKQMMNRLLSGGFVSKSNLVQER